MLSHFCSPKKNKKIKKISEICLRMLLSDFVFISLETSSRKLGQFQNAKMFSKSSKKKRGLYGNKNEIESLKIFSLL